MHRSASLRYFDAREMRAMAKGLLHRIAPELLGQVPDPDFEREQAAEKVTGALQTQRKMLNRASQLLVAGAHSAHNSASFLED
jgi:hypothetical protein